MLNLSINVLSWRICGPPVHESTYAEYEVRTIATMRDEQTGRDSGLGTVSKKWVRYRELIRFFRYLECDPIMADYDVTFDLPKKIWFWGNMNPVNLDKRRDMFEVCFNRVSGILPHPEELQRFLQLEVINNRLSQSAGVDVNTRTRLQSVEENEEEEEE